MDLNKAHQPMTLICSIMFVPSFQLLAKNDSTIAVGAMMMTLCQSACMLSIAEQVPPCF